jgi:general secretion pathway protein G
MKTKAFTLIEVMVVMAILSILAGMMAPAVWKLWEGEEISTTRLRMQEIKKGLVGDRTLVQNGIRTNFGFVGDNGELPVFANNSTGLLAYLIVKPNGGYPHWNGPYLSGFGVNWNRDAWGKLFSYTITKDTSGRNVNAELRSAGPDGIFGTSDDIDDQDLQVSDREVTPTNLIKGNIYGIYSGLPSLNLAITFKDIKNFGYSTNSQCIHLTSSSSFSSYTAMLFDSASHPLKLPIGEIEITANLYFKNNNCDNSTPKSTSTFLYFVTDNINQIILPELR